jgi:hypothetical protein
MLKIFKLGNLHREALNVITLKSTREIRFVVQEHMSRIYIYTYIFNYDFKILEIDKIHLLVV